MEPVEEDTEPVLPSGVEVDRRRARRRQLMVPATIATRAHAQRFGMTCNVSRTGALLATPARFAIGERALVRFQRPTGDVSHEVQGRIVRLEINSHDSSGIWRYLMAVRFERPLPTGIVLQTG